MVFVQPLAKAQTAPCSAYVKITARVRSSLAVTLDCDCNADADCYSSKAIPILDGMFMSYECQCFITGLEAMCYHVDESHPAVFK